MNLLGCSLLPKHIAQCLLSRGFICNRVSVQNKPQGSTDRQVRRLTGPNRLKTFQFFFGPGLLPAFQILVNFGPVRDLQIFAGPVRP